jgi:hypothetical protein
MVAPHMPYRVRALSASLFVALLVVAPAVSATSYAGPLQRDFMREEVMRMVNGERTWQGLTKFKLDTFLAAKAQDSPIRCPNDATKLNPGRAQSVAAQNVIPAPHPLPLCKSYTVLSVFPYWNYSGYRAEILAVDNQDYSRVRYDYGCPIGSQLTCGHSSYTYAPFTAAQAVRMWMNSSTHRAKMLGSYTRLGCGVWQGGTAYYGGYAYTDTRWYSCIFGNAGPTANKDLTAPTITGLSLDGVAYVSGMAVDASVTVRFTLTDTGGPTPRVSDWWAYMDGNNTRTQSTFREGAFDAVGKTAAVSFSLDLSSLTAGSHSLTIVGRGMDTRQVTASLALQLVK